MKVKLFVTAIMLALSQAVFAGGFQINEHGARAMAMGGAFTAIANDPSAIYFNAAGITQLRGFHLMLGTTMIAPDATFRGVTPAITEYKMNSQSFFPTHFYATYQVNKDLFIGLGFTTPFGLGTKWNDNWVGRYLAVKTDLKTFAINPSIAYKLSDQLSISGSFEYSFASVTITQKTPQTPFNGDAFVHLTGKDNSAFGYQFGILYKPVHKLSIGASFHSQIKYNFAGTVNTTGAQQLIDAKKLPEGDANAPLTVPMNLSVGIAYDFLPQLKISAEFQYIGWSSYDTLKVNFADPAYEDIASPRMYNNSFILRLGGEYQLASNISVDAGILYDKNPVKPEYLNPSLPDANRLGFSFGVNYKLTSSLQADLGYLFIRGQQTAVTNSKETYTEGNTPFNGTYNTSASLLSLSLSYSL